MTIKASKPPFSSKKTIRLIDRMKKSSLILFDKSRPRRIALGFSSLCVASGTVNQTKAKLSERTFNWPFNRTTGFSKARKLPTANYQILCWIMRCSFFLDELVSFCIIFALIWKRNYTKCRELKFSRFKLPRLQFATCTLRTDWHVGMKIVCDPWNDVKVIQLI